MKYSIIHINNRSENNIKNNMEILKSFEYVDDIEYFNGIINDGEKFLIDIGINTKCWNPYDGRTSKVLPGEYGVWISVINIWQYIVDNNIPKMLVLEDDVVIDKNFIYNLNLHMNDLPKDFDFLSLHYLSDQNFEDENLEIGSKYIKKSTNQYSGGTAIIYSNAGAKKLLGLVYEKGIEYTSDCFIYRQAFLEKVNGYSIKGRHDLFVVHNNDTNNSIIDPNNYRSNKYGKIAYDFGANNGDNIPYYLLKFEKVVAIEANPELTKLICDRFKEEILQGRVFVENCAVSLNNDIVKFYIHKNNHVLSQIYVPENLDDFNIIEIESKTPSSIIKKYGDPEYIKIDIEFADKDIIYDLFINNIYPNYISAEVQDISVFSLLTSSDKYKKFKLLDGSTISSRYSNITVNNQSYSFPHHSAGPMFEDINSKEMDKTQLFYKLASEKIGWKDIHAKKEK